MCQRKSGQGIKAFYRKACSTRFSLLGPMSRKSTIKYALLMLSYPAKASAFSSNAA